MKSKKIHLQFYIPPSLSIRSDCTNSNSQRSSLPNEDDRSDAGLLTETRFFQLREAVRRDIDGNDFRFIFFFSLGENWPCPPPTPGSGDDAVAFVKNDGICGFSGFGLRGP